MVALLGLGGSFVGCAADDDGGEPASDGLSVIVIGAGVAGMTAGHLLARRGVDVRILEAAPTHGGRIKHDTAFVDFPIPLGAEWLHASPDELAAIVDDSEVEVTTTLADYDPTDLVGHFDGELTFEEIGEWEDLKFVGSSWLDFFDEYVVPGIADRMEFDTRIVSIDHSGDRVIATDAEGTEHEADAVIVTVPVLALRRRDIEFVPDLPEPQRSAIDEVAVWGGLKMFVEFTERFYPAYLEFPDSDTDDGQRAYYDAAYGQDSDTNVLGLFAVGAQAERYQAEADGLIDLVLAELDEIFDGAASRGYVQHIVQDWSAEPFVGQAYVADTADWRLVRELGTSIGERVYFAGEGYTDGSGWGAAHVAAASARSVVDELRSDE